jgi:hypothetical protein
VACGDVDSIGGRWPVGCEQPARQGPGGGHGRDMMVSADAMGLGDCRFRHLSCKELLRIHRFVHGLASEPIAGNVRGAAGSVEDRHNETYWVMGLA